MAVTNYYADLVNENFLRGIEQTRPADIYVALFTNPTDDEGGGTEMTGGGYARQIVTFTESTGGQVVNEDVVTFLDFPGGDDITHIALFDAVTAGHMLIHAPLSSTVTPDAGTDLTFGPGDLAAGI